MSKVEFKSRIKKTVVLFIAVIVTISIAGIIINQNKAALTGSDNVVSERVLIPGGQSIGIEMSVKGALIVGVENNAGPEAGDMIISVEGHKVESPTDVSKYVEASKNDTIKITVMRNKRKLNFDIKPYFDAEKDQYFLGLWIKDKIAGIGTLTFYDPTTNKFALLGHGIYEAETNTLLQSKNGYLLNTKVNKIQAGKVGKPGEIGGIIYNFDKPMGRIEKNTEFGVYGSADNGENIDLSQPMVMAKQDQIKEGKAYIFTTIDGTNVQKFEISITKIHHQSEAANKGIEFKVDDKKLLESCGGIIQGMSGSPIIQNNRLVGAVTHVFINNPTRGYGIFAEWMVEEVEK